MKIKDKIKEWLFSDEIFKINQLEEQLEESTKRLGAAAVELDIAKTTIEECRKLLTQFVDIGVDVNYHSDDPSWAVVCISGRPEYVRIMPLAPKDARGVYEFLQMFEYSGKVIADSPIGFMPRNRFFKKC